MNKKSIAIAGLAAIVIACVAYVAIRQAHPLPSTFTITMHGDFTSSGGSRYADETYTFAKNALASGSATWVSNAGGGCQKDCGNTEQCIVVDNQWVEVQKWQGCETQFGPVPTKQSLEAKIKSGELVKKDSSASAHGRYYYEIGAA